MPALVDQLEKQLETASAQIGRGAHVLLVYPDGRIEGITCEAGRVMEFEVDFLAVGEESKSGDAITLRYGYLSAPRNEQDDDHIRGLFDAPQPEIKDPTLRRMFQQIYRPLGVSQPTLEYRAYLREWIWR